jgi:hypothetical protein
MHIEHTRLIIALLIIIGFFGVVTFVLLGFVDVQSTEIAKLVGLIVGYLVALLNPIILRYFETPIPPPKD